MDNKLIIKTALQGALSAIEGLPDDAPNNDTALSLQNNLIQQIQEALKHKKTIDTCEVTITNNCGIAAGGPQPMCVYTAYENNNFTTKIIYWRELLDTSTITIVKNTPFVIKDADFQGIAPELKGEYTKEYSDGSQFFVYKIMSDCNIKIYC